MENVEEKKITIEDIITEMHNRVDYSIEDVEDRKKLIEEILFEYEDDIYDHLSKYDLKTNSDLSYLLNRMANYLVYANRKEWRKKKRQNKSINKNEVLVNDIEKYLEIKNKEVETKGGYNVVPATKIKKQDLKKYKEIGKIYNAIHLYRQIRSSSKNRDSIRKINRAIAHLKTDAKYIKEFLSGTFKFKNILRNKPEYNFDVDTGYFNDVGDYILVSENQLDYGDKKHIYYLIKFYSALKQESYNDNNADMKHILFLLEYLIDNTGLSDRDIDIITWIIDGDNYETIGEKLKEKYNLNWYGDTISRTFDSICSKIADFYRKDYEDWFYTFVAKGKYKTCSKCGEVKLANERYFSPRSDDKGDGFYSYCRKCGQNYYKPDKVQ